MPFNTKEKKRAWNRRYSRVHNAKPHVRAKHRESWLRRAYGLTPDQYDQLLASQGGVCAICRSNETFLHGASRDPARRRKTRLAVDHCHKTGKVRGILCPRCNVMVNRDDPELLERAAEYLRRSVGR